MSKYELTPEQIAEGYRIEPPKDKFYPTKLYDKEGNYFFIHDRDNFIMDKDGNTWDLDEFSVEEAIGKSKNLPTPEQVGEGLEVILDKKGCVTLWSNADGTSPKFKRPYLERLSEQGFFFPYIDKALEKYSQSILSPEQIAEGYKIYFNGFYEPLLIDKNNNRWSIENTPLTEAIEKSKTLVNCRDCFNCFNCNDCEKCWDCVDCYECNDCWKCENCSWCSRCFGCDNCSTCNKCDYCEDCKDCQKCKNCKECKYCTKVNRSKNCSNCYACKDSTKLISCENCKDCNDCKECNRCNDCKDCKDCQDCRFCDDCKDCVDCRCSEHCVECKKCLSCKDCKDCKDCTECKECQHCSDCRDEKELDNSDDNERVLR